MPSKNNKFSSKNRRMFLQNANKRELKEYFQNLSIVANVDDKYAKMLKSDMKFVQNGGAWENGYNSAEEEERQYEEKGRYGQYGFINNSAGQSRFNNGVDEKKTQSGEYNPPSPGVPNNRPSEVVANSRYPVNQSDSPGSGGVCVIL